MERVDRPGSEEPPTDEPDGFLSLLLANVNDAVFATDAGFRIRHWNPGAESTYGWTRDEAIGRDARDVLQIRWRGDERAGILEELDRTGTYRGELVHTRKDGTPLDVESRTSVVRTADGNVVYVTVNRDISDRKEAEAARARSEARYRSLVEASSQLVWVAGADGSTIELSPRLVELTGRTETEDRDDWLRAVHPEDRERTAALWSRALEEGTPFISEYRIEMADGTHRSILDRGVPIRDDEGRMVEWVGMYTDITDRKLAEAARAEAEAFYRQLAEIGPAIVYRHSLEDPMPVVFMGPRIEALLGYPAEAWTEDPDFWMSVVHPDDVTRVETADEEAIATDGELDIEYRFVAADGRIVWVRDQATVVRDAVGRPIARQGVLTDTTERVIAEEAIRKSRESMEVAQSRAHLGSWELLAGAEAGEWSAEMFRLFGVDPSGGAPTWEGFLDLLHPDDRRRIEDAQRRLFENGEQVVLEFRTDPARGPERVMEATVGGVRDERGEIARLSGTVLDVTERKLSQDALRATAEDRSRLLAALVTAQEDERARISRELHDGLGQVLTSLALFSWDLERDEMDQTQRARIAGFRSRVQGAIGDLRRLVWSLRPVELDKAGLVAAIGRLVTEIGVAQGIAVDFIEDVGKAIVSPPIDVTVYRVVQEAVTNALRHARPGSISVAVLLQGGRLIAVVEDDGVGFDTSVQPGGFGILGMRERAQLAGGSLAIESAPGSGTTVRLEVPIEPEA